MSMYSLVPALLMLGVGGCSVEGAASPERYHQALELVDKGVSFLRQEQFDQAQAAFLIAYDLAEIPEAVDGLGCVAFSQGDVATAERLFTRAFEIDPGYSEALANLALALEARRQLDSAETLYRRVLVYNPVDIKARNNFAALLFDKKDYAGAKLELSQARVLVQHALIEQNAALLKSAADIE